MRQIIDISEHNGQIDFMKVREAGIDTCIIRVGWIGNKNNHTLDKRFEEYYLKARYCGFKIGFYVYSYCLSPATVLQGAEWTLKQLRNKRADLPIFIDLEDTTIKSRGKQELTQHAVVFCEKLKKAGYDVGVYASLDWFKNYLDINKLLDYKIWLAEWTTNKNHSFKYKVDLWQYTSNGRIDGINSRVDLSYCMCDCENTQNNSNGGNFEMPKVYKNGSTPEDVYSDSLLKFKIGSLNKYEQCECIGKEAGRFIVKYKVNGTNAYKVGFVKYHGGVK